MDKQLPLIELTIDESQDSEVEVNYIALVDKPAIEKNFLAFSDSPSPLSFASVNDEEQVVIGPAMIPDQPIYRNDAENGEYYVTFSKDTVKAIALKFFAKGYQSNVNLMHDAGQQVEDVTFFQSFIKDEAKGIAGMPGEYPDGTWFLGAKIGNADVWQKVKAGEIKGFSVEGVFQYKQKPKTEEQVYDEIKRLLSNLPI